MRLFLSVLLFLGVSATASAQSLVLASFNVESGDDTRAERVVEDIVRMPALHLWALQEVEDQETLDYFVSTLNEATGMTYVGHMGSTGGRYDDDYLDVHL